MFDPQKLIDKKKEIHEIFAAHGDFVVRTFGSKFPSSTDRDADVDALVYLEEDNQFDVIFCVAMNSKAVGRIPATQQNDFCWSVIFAAQALLDCKVNIVNERALERNYPKTYAKLAC